jgi:hypothetical protein
MGPGIAVDLLQLFYLGLSGMFPWRTPTYALELLLR